MNVCPKEWNVSPLKLWPDSPFALRISSPRTPARVERSKNGGLSLQRLVREINIIDPYAARAVSSAHKHDIH